MNYLLSLRWFLCRSQNIIYQETIEFTIPIRLKNCAKSEMVPLSQPHGRRANRNFLKKTRIENEMFSQRQGCIILINKEQLPIEMFNNIIRSYSRNNRTLIKYGAHETKE